MLAEFSKLKDWLNKRVSNELDGNSYPVPSMVTVWLSPGFQAIVKNLLNRSLVKNNRSKPASCLKSINSPPVFSSLKVSFMVNQTNNQNTKEASQPKIGYPVKRTGPICLLQQMGPVE
jgi:hypothetical protein